MDSGGCFPPWFHLRRVAAKKMAPSPPFSYLSPLRCVAQGLNSPRVGAFVRYDGRMVYVSSGPTLQTPARLLRKIVHLHRFFMRESLPYMWPDYRGYKRGFWRAYVRFMWFSLRY